jgi:hypothetical protein
MNDYLQCERYVYPGLNQNIAFCDIEIIGENSEQPLVIMTEREDNEVTSITNAIETLTKRIYEEFFEGKGLSPGQIRFVEHYPANMWRAETYDEVIFQHDKAPFTGVSWKRTEAPQRL